MKAILKTPDMMLTNHVIRLLEEEGIQAFQFDQNISAVEGSIGIFPRRIMVIDEDFPMAKTILTQAGLEHELED